MEGITRLASRWLLNGCWMVLAMEVVGNRLVVRMGEAIAWCRLVVVEDGAVVIVGGEEGRDKG